MLRFYAYKNCDSCRKARKWLVANRLDFKEIPIRDEPPSISELEQALSQKGSIKALFNTSGVDYRKMNLKEKLPTLSQKEALTLLNQNGNLVKRPFLIDTTSHQVLIGFKEDTWAATFA